MATLMHAQHLAMLGFLKQILDDLELPTQLFERSEDVPIHYLIAGIQKDGAGRNRYLQFSFLPLDDDEIPSLQLLQIYSALPFSPNLIKIENLTQQLLDCNNRSPVGHFGISEENEIYLRYIYALPSASTFAPDETIELLSLFVHTLDTFAESIEQVTK